MKSLCLVGLALAFLASTAAADNFGSTFGNMTTAQASGRGQSTLSGTVGFADVSTSFLAGFNYGFTDNMDGRLRVGVVDLDGFDSQFALNGDVRWQIWDSEATTMSAARKPFDMSLGAFSEWMNVDTGTYFGSSTSMTVFQLGFQMLGSKSFPMSNGTALTPYGRLNIRYENLSMQFTDSQLGSFSASDSHAALGLNAGMAWELTPHVALLGEFQIDGNDGLFLGLDYKF